MIKITQSLKLIPVSLIIISIPYDTSVTELSAPLSFWRRAIQYASCSYKNPYMIAGTALAIGGGVTAFVKRNSIQQWTCKNFPSVFSWFRKQYRSVDNNFKRRYYTNHFKTLFLPKNLTFSIGDISQTIALDKPHVSSSTIPEDYLYRSAVIKSFKDITQESTKISFYIHHDQKDTTIDVDFEQFSKNECPQWLTKYFNKNSNNEFITFAYQSASEDKKIITNIDRITLLLGILIAYQQYQKKNNKESNQNVDETIQSLIKQFNILHHQEFTQLLAHSESFNNNICTFPTETNRIKTVAYNDSNKKIRIAMQARCTRPIVHPATIELMKNFLTYKKQHGSTVEKELYTNMTTNQFIDRLLTKRPLTFVGKADEALLQNRQRYWSKFETIGTDAECSPLILKDYLSYDEMQISALIGVSSPTYFINNGNRNNRAQFHTSGTFQQDGIYIGLVGARFEKPDLMESQHILITQSSKHNTPQELRAIWKNFYNNKKPFVSFDQAKKDRSGRYYQIDDDTYFDTENYMKRMHLVIEPFLFEANERGKEANKKVYCHVVGLGLGVWQKNQKLQAKLMLDVYINILQKTNLRYIADIDFSWFPKTCNNQPPKTINGINIHFSQRNPADKLADDSKLLVAMYAWDGNAYPGNEYWKGSGSLSASGDPAAACCSTIAELQNPLINRHLLSQQHKRKRRSIAS